MVRPGQRESRIDVHLRDWVRITGVVELDDGRRLDGVRVVGSSPDARSSETRTALDGSFELARIHPTGTYALHAFLSDEQRAALGIPGFEGAGGGGSSGGGINLIMCSDGRQRVATVRDVKAADAAVVRIVIRRADLPTGTLLGTVVRSEDGSLVEEFQGRVIEFHKDGVGDKNFWTDDRGPGHFRIAGIPVGLKVMLEVRAKGLATGWYGPWVATAVAAGGRPAGKEIVIRLQRPEILSCRILLDGRPAVGASVTASAVIKRPTRDAPLPAKSGVDGTARLKLAPGRYEIRATTGARGGQVMVDVGSGRTNVVDVVISR